MRGILRVLEPHALDLWENELETWMPSGFRASEIHKQTMFDGLYQMIRITV